MKKAKRATNKRTSKRTKKAPKHPSEADREVETRTFLLNSPERPDTSSSPVDTGGDVDADWQRAQSSGEEAVGGTVATPDQDVVDEIARPLGVERSTDAEVITSDEILSGRDRKRWRIEQSADERARDTEQP